MEKMFTHVVRANNQTLKLYHPMRRVELWDYLMKNPTVDFYHKERGKICIITFWSSQIVATDDSLMEEEPIDLEAPEPEPVVSIKREPPQPTMPRPNRRVVIHSTKRT